MNKQVLNWCSASILGMTMSSSLLAESADEEGPVNFIGPEPFEECMGEDYYNPEKTAQEAYDQGECFMGLLNEMKADNLVGNTPIESDKMLLLMQYADSWFDTAATLGHEGAKSRLFSNRLALNFYPSSNQVADYQLQMVVSTEFSELDTDNSGLLSPSEAAPHSQLATHFLDRDLDGDGAVSQEEFIIFYGEATAAGQ